MRRGSELKVVAQRKTRLFRQPRWKGSLWRGFIQGLNIQSRKITRIPEKRCYITLLRLDSKATTAWNDEVLTWKRRKWREGEWRQRERGRHTWLWMKRWREKCQDTRLCLQDVIQRKSLLIDDMDIGVIIVASFIPSLDVSVVNVSTEWLVRRDIVLDWTVQLSKERKSAWEKDWEVTARNTLGSSSLPDTLFETTAETFTTRAPSLDSCPLMWVLHQNSQEVGSRWPRRSIFPRNYWRLLRKLLNRRKVGMVRKPKITCSRCWRLTGLILRQPKLDNNFLHLTWREFLRSSQSNWI